MGHSNTGCGARAACRSADGADRVERRYGYISAKVAHSSQHDGAGACRPQDPIRFSGTVTPCVVRQGRVLNVGYLYETSESNLLKKCTPDAHAPDASSFLAA